jgi:predicted TPR repeat methyltransferase
MESDFRKELYKRYNSTFKIHISNFDSTSIKKMWRSYDFRYLPLISDFGKDSLILELGCGRGYMLEYLRNRGFNNLKGIDISEEQIKISREKRFDVEVTDVFDYLNKCSQKYKIIIALDFIEHFYKAELIELFQLIYNCLNVGGLFIFHTPNGQSILSHEMLYGDLTHSTIFTPNSAQQLLRSVGFTNIKFYETGPTYKNINGIVRSILWKLVKFAYNIIKMIEAGYREKILTQNFIGIARKKQ